MIKCNAVINNKAFAGNIVFDSDLARIYLDCWLESAPVLKTSDYLVIFKDDEHKNAPHFKASELRKKTKEELHTLRGDLLDCYTDCTKQEIIEDLLEITNEDYYRFAVDLEPDYKIFGYSQGDMIAVIDLSGMATNREYLRNLFFDCPLAGCITETNIETGEETEYFFNDYLDDGYSYNKEELVRNVAKDNQDLAVYLI